MRSIDGAQSWRQEIGSFSQSVSNSDLAIEVAAEIWHDAEVKSGIYEKQSAEAPELATFGVGVHRAAKTPWGEVKVAYVLDSKNLTAADNQAQQDENALEKPGNDFAKLLNGVDEAIRQNNYVAVDNAINSVFGTTTKRSIGTDANGEWNLKVQLSKDAATSELKFPINATFDMGAFLATNNSDLGFHKGFPIPAPPNMKMEGEVSVNPFTALSDLTEMNSLQTQVAQKAADISKWLNEHQDDWTKKDADLDKTKQALQAKFGSDFVASFGYNADSKPSVELSWSKGAYQAQVEITSEKSAGKKGDVPPPIVPTRREPPEDGGTTQENPFGKGGPPGGGADPPKPTNKTVEIDPTSDGGGGSATVENHESMLGKAADFVKEHPILTATGVAAVALATHKFGWLTAARAQLKELLPEGAKVLKNEPIIEETLETTAKTVAPDLRTYVGRVMTSDAEAAKVVDAAKMTEAAKVVDTAKVAEAAPIAAEAEKVKDTAVVVTDASKAKDATGIIANDEKAENATGIVAETERKIAEVVLPPHRTVPPVKMVTPDELANGGKPVLRPQNPVAADHSQLRIKIDGLVNEVKNTPPQTVLNSVEETLQKDASDLLTKLKNKEITHEEFEKLLADLFKAARKDR